MNKPGRIILTVVLLAGAALSAGVTAYLLLTANRDAFGEWLAPVHVNIEMDKNYTNDLSIYSEPHANQYYYLSPTTSVDSPMKNVVMHTQLRTIGFHRRIYLRAPEAAAEGLINAIDSISIFAGNKLYYFSPGDIQKFGKRTRDGYALFQIPGVHYTRSLVVKDWVNYYGELNIALKAFFTFLFSPGRFIPAYLFFAGLLFLYRKQLVALYGKIRQKPVPWAGIFILIITVLGFALRINGYTRHSGWTDELYSATSAGNPYMPFLATFGDPGNPPFYFMLLRFWFTLFGWSEEAGTMLSVVLGTLAIPALYLAVKGNFGRTAALAAAFFMSISGFAVAYSQEMRAYILLICLAPVLTMLFFNFLRRQSIGNLILYVIPSFCMVNAHYYGILFIMANFVFYCLYQGFKGSFAWKKTLAFLAGNLVIALSFVPYFLYQIAQHNNFDRNFELSGDHLLIFVVIAVLAAMAFIYRKKITLNHLFTGKQFAFFLYSLFVPLAIFTLAFVISFVKPMISYRYILPVSFPFFLAFAAMLVWVCLSNKKLQWLSLFFVWAVSAALYVGEAGIPGGGTEAYRESRAYIAADAAAHPGKKSAMLDNAPQSAQYYGFDDLPLYSPESRPDVLYVFNGMFIMHEENMYDELTKHGLDDTNMLKIIPNDRIVIFKKAFIHSP